MWICAVLFFKEEFRCLVSSLVFEYWLELISLLSEHSLRVACLKEEDTGRLLWFSVPELKSFNLPPKLPPELFVLATELLPTPKAT
jgi:hypothetical protein